MLYIKFMSTSYEIALKWIRMPHNTSDSKSTLVNLLWPRDTIWWHKSGSALVQVMACCLQHQAITWTNVELSSVRSNDIDLSAILQETLQPSVTEISLKITYIQFCSNLLGANELRWSLFAVRQQAITWANVDLIYVIISCHSATMS